MHLSTSLLDSFRVPVLLLALLLLPACRSENPPAGPTATPTAAIIPATVTPTLDQTSPATDIATDTIPASVTPPPATAEQPDMSPAGSTFQYGVIQPVATLDEARSPDIIRANLQQIAALNSNTVYQVFPEGMMPEEWRAYLDIAQEEGLSVLVGPSWISENPNPDDLSPVLSMLDAFGDHPALRGFVYLHEPWEMFTTAEIQAMYSIIKAEHPDVPLAVFWSGELQKGNQGDRTFTDGLCDICIVNLKAFQEDPQLSDYQSLERMAVSAPIIAANDPDAELWSSTQVWAPPDGGRRGFRVPSAAEMEELLCTLTAEYPLQGYLWSAWQMDKATTGTLADSELAIQREAIPTIYESCVP